VAYTLSPREKDGAEKQVRELVIYARQFRVPLDRWPDDIEAKASIDFAPNVPYSETVEVNRAFKAEVRRLALGWVEYYRRHPEMLYGR
jgi:hypothetical protein